MTNDHVLYEKIDLYLKNTLPEEELQAFAIELSKDSSLQELVKVQRVANQIVYTKQLIALQTKIQSDLNGSKHWYNSRIWSWIGMIAMVTIGLFLYFVNLSDKPSTDTNSSLRKEDTNKQMVEILTEPSQQNFQNKPTNSTTQSPDKIITINSIAVDSNAFVVNDQDNKKSDQKITGEPNLNPAIEATSKKEPVKIDCSLLNIDQAITVSSTCAGEQNGKISFIPSKIFGGKAPFSYSLHRKENLSVKSEFLYLNAGSYTVYVSDANQCLTTKIIELEETACKKSNAFAFTPELEKWKIPVQENKQGTLKIFNKSGILVYTSEVSSENENYWDGTSSTGQTLETGYFTYKISYSDGEEEVGSVSILRR